MLTLNDGRNELWQWDTGRTLAVDADCSQVHFSNKVFGRSIDVDVVDGVAIIPEILLQTDKDLNVWAFVGTTESGYTKISKKFKVNRRNKPADYVFTPPDQTSLEEIKERLEYLESIQDPDAIKNAVDDYLEQNPVETPVESVNGKTGKVELSAEDVGAISKETDPTVPAWAKQPIKPSYTAAEVGAQIADFVINCEYVDGKEAKPDKTWNEMVTAYESGARLICVYAGTIYDFSAYYEGENFIFDFYDGLRLQSNAVMMAPDNTAYIKKINAKDNQPGAFPVQSVNGQTGEVKLTAEDVGAISQDDLQNQLNEANATIARLEYMIVHNDFYAPLAVDDTGTLLTDDLGNVIVADWKHIET